MLQVNLDKGQKRKLDKLLLKEKDARVWRRLRAIKLRCEHVKPKEIAHMFGVRRETVTYWVNLFLAGGFTKLASLEYKGSVSVLEPHREDIRYLIERESVPTLSDLRRKVKKNFGVEIGETGLYKWCKKKLMLPLKRPS